MKQKIFSHLRREVVETFVLRMAGTSLSFFMHAILARKLGPEGYGSFTYILAVTSVLAIIITLGLPNGTMRFVVEYREKKEWDLLKGVLIRSLQLILGMALIGITILLINVKLLPIAESLRESLFYSSLILPLVALGIWRSKAIRGFHRLRESLLPEEILLPLLAGVIFLLSSVQTVGEAIFIYLASYIGIIALGFWWLFYFLPPQSKMIAAKYNTRLWLKTSYPMMWSTFMQLTLRKIDILMLGIIGGMDTTGFYNAASRIALLITFLLSVVEAGLAPRIASAYHGNRIKELQGIIKKGIVWSIMGALPLFIIIMIGAETILGLFAPDFREASFLLRILASGQLINAMTGPVGYALLMTDNEKLFAKIVWNSTLLNVLGNVFAIPIWNAYGAAFVTALSISVLNLRLLIAVRQKGMLFL